MAKTHSWTTVLKCLCLICGAVFGPPKVSERGSRAEFAPGTAATFLMMVMIHGLLELSLGRVDNAPETQKSHTHSLYRVNTKGLNTGHGEILPSVGC